MATGYEGRRVSRPPTRRKQTTTKGQEKHLIQLVIAGAIFVLLVAWKLLLPQSMETLSASISKVLGENADFEAAFSAVGKAIAGEEKVEDSLKDAYTAVFAPSTYSAQKTSATIAYAKTASLPATRLREELSELVKPEPEEPIISQEELVSKSDGAVTFSAAAPDNVSFGQAVMGFSYVTPTEGTLTDSFGYRIHPIHNDKRFHYGLDIANVIGTPIYAFADGEVYAIGENDSLGNYVLLHHDNDIVTLYAHCSELLVSGGETVTMGEEIAKMGSTGQSTGSHLHFEVREGDTYLNPIYYVEVNQR